MSTVSPPASLPDDAPRVASADAPCATALHRWTSPELLGNAQVVEIDHKGAIYRLRITAQDRLILTK